MLKTFNNLNKSSCSDCIDMSCAVSLLNKIEFELLSDHSIESEVKKGEIILRADTLISTIIYLKTGFVKEFVTGSNNRSRILQIVTPHSYLGLHSLFGDKINHFSYAALQDLKVCYIDINIFKQLIKENGSFAYQIIREINQENLLNYYRFISGGNKKTDGRFADTLLYFSKEIYDSQQFELQLSRQELSEFIGISRENTARVLTKFSNDGIIGISGRKISILKPELLKKISGNG